MIIKKNIILLLAYIACINFYATKEETSLHRSINEKLTRLRMQQTREARHADAILSAACLNNGKIPPFKTITDDDICAVQRLKHMGLINSKNCIPYGILQVLR